MKTKQLLYGAIAIAVLLLSVPFLRAYIVWSVGQIFYFVLAILSIHVVEKGRGSTRFGWLSMLLLIAFLGLKVKVLFLSSLLFFLLFVGEQGWGRLNNTPLFAAILVGPAGQYVLNTMSFPVRLELTSSVGKMLSRFYPEVSTKGNMIDFSGVEFIVSDACLGLSMFQSALMMTLFLIGYYERQKAIHLHWLGIGFFLVLAGVLVLIANWVRILLTVLFKSMPDTFGHEVIGIICLAAYVLIPILWIIKKMGPMWVKKVVKERPVSPFSLPIAVLLALGIAYCTFSFDRLERTAMDQTVEKLVVEGYERKLLDSGILQFLGDSSLVYVKPGVPVFASDHNPKICWRGSGYEFAGEYLGDVDGQSVIFSQLVTPDGQTWYSCWWYDSGLEQTTSQWAWRWGTMTSRKPYRLINITAENERLLKLEAKKWMTIMKYFRD